MTARRTHRDKEAERPWKRGRWFWASTLIPALLLPVALVVASAVLPGLSQQRPAEPRPQGTSDRPETRQLGVTGQLPRQQHPGEQLLDEAGKPDELATSAGAPAEVPDGPLGIPAPVLVAYREGADRLAVSEPGCGVDWSVLASIGRIESGHARSGRVDAEGTTASAILGPRLSGRGVAAIPDTDRGGLDGDPVWDRAVGPMQFLPSTWQRHAVDANGDGRANPHNVGDASAAAGHVLCSGGADLREPRELAAAVFRYNHSDDYVRTVLVWADAYSRGVTPTPGQVAPQLDDRRDVLAGSRLPDVAAPEDPSVGWPVPVEPGAVAPPEVAAVPPAAEVPPAGLPSAGVPPAGVPPAGVPSAELPSEPGPSPPPSPVEPGMTGTPVPPGSDPTSSDPPDAELPGATSSPPSEPSPSETPSTSSQPPTSSQSQPPSTAPSRTSSGAPSSEPSTSGSAELSTSRGPTPDDPAERGAEDACASVPLLPAEVPSGRPPSEVVARSDADHPDAHDQRADVARDDLSSGSCGVPSNEPSGLRKTPAD